MAKILVIDDEKNITSSFEKVFGDEGYKVFSAQSAEEGLKILKSESMDVAVMDIRMPGLSGLEALAKIKVIDPKLPVILMTAFGTTESAIDAMRLGAFDYVIKPFEVPTVKAIIEKALSASSFMKTGVFVDEELMTQGEVIIGKSSKMQEVYKLIGRVAVSDVTVLLRGESGTGKELVARAIYHHSNRKDKSFLAVNTAAIPETLLESELFGYENGAFTDAKDRRIGKLEQCSGGTLFLDEIGDMPPHTQAKILRVIEDKSFERLGGNQPVKTDVRLIAATNKNLEEMIREGKFREDLYYRLNVVAIELPPIRDRKDDIPRLAQYFLKKYGREFDRKDVKLSDEASKKLTDYSWPGNVRELENVIKKALLLSKGEALLPEYIQIIQRNDETNKHLTAFDELLRQFMKNDSMEGKLYDEVLSKVEKTLIQEVLTQTKGNQTKAAKILGLSRPTLKEKIDRHGLKKEVLIDSE